MATFDERMAELEQRVGGGRLVGRVSFAPAKIAVPQHRGTWFSGPNAGVMIRHWTTPGTGPGYLTDPLLENVERYLRDIAREFLTVGPRAPLERSMEDLLAHAERRIPRKTGVLAESGDASVSETLVGHLG